MSQHRAVTDRIIKAVRQAPGCQFDDLALNLPDLAWNEVFLEVEHLSQTGQVCVTAKGEGIYTVRLPNKEIIARPHTAAGHKSGPFKRHSTLQEEKKAA